MKKSLLLLSILSLALTGCTADQTISEETSIEVVTSFYPLAFMTSEIAGEALNVTNLAGATDVHDYEPSPKDLVKINEAALVIFQGAELEPWTDGVIEGLANKGIATLEVTHDLELAPHKDEHDEHEEGQHDEDEHDDHGHGEFDPHTWLDPVLAQEMVNEIMTALINIDPENQSNYRANAKKLNNQFATLDKDFVSGLASCENQEVITSHDAFGYLGRRYDFEIHAIAGLSTNDEPSAQVLAELKDEAAEGITHILVEENSIRAFAETLARETGLAMLPVNPLGRGALSSDQDFFSVMETNLDSFKTALNCQ